jgi:hypothetical protein
MNSPGFSRLGVLASGLVIAAAMAFAPDVAPTAGDSPASSAAGTSASGFGELVAQQGGGCERTRRPACNRPGRRSTHR